MGETLVEKQRETGKGWRRKRKGFGIPPREVPFNFSAVVAPMAKWEPRFPNGMHHYTQLNILLKVAAAMQPLVTVTIATITVATVLAVDKG